MIVEPASVESFSLILLLVCRALAFLSGMGKAEEVRRFAGSDVG